MKYPTQSPSTNQPASMFCSLLKRVIHPSTHHYSIQQDTAVFMSISHNSGFWGLDRYQHFWGCCYFQLQKREPKRWRQHSSSKLRYLFTEVHGNTSLKTLILIITRHKQYQARDGNTTLQQITIHFLIHRTKVDKRDSKTSTCHVWFWAYITV